MCIAGCRADHPGVNSGLVKEPTVYEKITLIAELHQKFFSWKQQEGETVLQFEVAIQELWKRLEEKGQEVCATIDALDLVRTV